MTLPARPARTARAAFPAAVLSAAAVLLCGAALVACAQPGQLGHALPAVAAPAAEAAPAAVPAAPAAAPATLEPAVGTVDGRVSIRTPGPAVYSVRTVVLDPGEALGWQRLPGTELAIVRSGDVSLVREDGCTPVRFTDGQALFVADGVPHRLANEGTGPAELVVTTLLAPGTPDSTEVAPACPED